MKRRYQQISGFKKFSDYCKSKAQMERFTGDLCPAGAGKFVSPALGFVHFDGRNKHRNIIFSIKVNKLD